MLILVRVLRFCVKGAAVFCACSGKSCVHPPVFTLAQTLVYSFGAGSDSHHILHVVLALLCRQNLLLYSQRRQMSAE